MKLVIAYIQPERLTEVKRSLQQAGVIRLSVTNALGAGSQGGYQESYRGAEVEIELLKKVRIEIAVKEEDLEPTVAAIVEGARSGNIGDGKIFVTDLAQCIRIRTGERGEDAVY